MYLYVYVASLYNYNSNEETPCKYGNQGRSHYLYTFNIMRNRPSVYCEEKDKKKKELVGIIRQIINENENIKGKIKIKECINK